MLKTLIVYLSVWGVLLVITPHVHGMPQDFQTGVMMAAAQAKEAVDNGAAARHDKSIEVLGAKYKNNMEVGFGDAVKHKRSISTDDLSDDSDYSYSDYSDYEETQKRRKRAVVYKNFVNKAKALYKKN